MLNRLGTLSINRTFWLVNFDSIGKWLDVSILYMAMKKDMVDLLSDTSELEEDKALEIIQKSKKKTIIVLNITRVKHLLNANRLSGLLDESTPHFTQEEIQQDVWEKIIENEVGMAVDNKVKELVQRSDTLRSFFDDSMIRKSHSVMMEVTKKIAFLSCVHAI